MTELVQLLDPTGRKKFGVIKLNILAQHRADTKEILRIKQQMKMSKDIEDTDEKETRKSFYCKF